MNDVVNNLSHVLQRRNVGNQAEKEIFQRKGRAANKVPSTSQPTAQAVRYVSTCAINFTDKNRIPFIVDRNRITNLFASQLKTLNCKALTSKIRSDFVSETQ